MYLYVTVTSEKSLAVECVVRYFAASPLRKDKLDLCTPLTNFFFQSISHTRETARF